MALRKYKPCGTYNDEGTLTGLRITSTLIKRLTYKNEPRQEICPRKEYHHILKGDVKTPPSDIMKRGILFEAICLKDEEVEYQMERKLRLRNGKQSVHTQRIYEAAERFAMIADKYEMTINENQVTVHGDLEIERFEHIKFELEGTIDNITGVNSPIFHHARAGIDMKLTMDRNSEFSEWSWGKPEYMDHVQLVLYGFLSKLPQAYMIFDYKARDRGHKFIPVATPEMFPNGQPEDLHMRQHYNLAKERFTDLRINIKDVAHTILKWDATEYEPEPSYEACKNCPLSPQNFNEDDQSLLCKQASYTSIV